METSTLGLRGMFPAVARMRTIEAHNLRCRTAHKPSISASILTPLPSLKKMTDTNNVEKYAEDQTVWDFTPTPNPSTNIAGDTIDSPEKWGALQEIRRVGQTEANKHLREAAKYQYAIHLIDVATGKRSPQFYYPIVGRGKGKDTGAKQDFYPRRHRRWMLPNPCSMLGDRSNQGCRYGT